jgi:hypothetical protein
METSFYLQWGGGAGKKEREERSSILCEWGGDEMAFKRRTNGIVDNKNGSMNERRGQSFFLDRICMDRSVRRLFLLALFLFVE